MNSREDYAVEFEQLVNCFLRDVGQLDVHFEVENTLSEAIRQISWH